MPIIQVDSEELKNLIKESVIEAIRQERLKFYEAIIPDVDDKEMHDIIEKYGEKPENLEYCDITSWFGNED